MTIHDLHQNKLLLLDAISGSHAYGLQHAESDVDKKGVFVLPKAQFYGLTNIEQINDERNDEVYYELSRFVDLLVKNNPNILELLLTPVDCILYKNPIFDTICLEDFISKKAQHSFAGYAMTQVKKARGLNKKIANPMPEKRQNILDFCYIVQGHRSLSLHDFLEQKNIRQEDCGLVKIAHTKGIFALFHSANALYQGILRHTEANEVALSSVPKGEQALATLFFNQDGYSAYCKSYREYWDWVKKRNQSRYQNTLSHGKNYDTKNMMHTFRLLHIAEEIAQRGTFDVRRTWDKDFLWKIRMGAFEYDELVARAEDKVLQIKALFEESDLPESANLEDTNALLLEIREYVYQG